MLPLTCFLIGLSLRLLSSMLISGSDHSFLPSVDFNTSFFSVLVTRALPSTPSKTLETCLSFYHRSVQQTSNAWVLTQLNWMYESIQKFVNLFFIRIPDSLRQLRFRKGIENWGNGGTDAVLILNIFNCPSFRAFNFGSDIYACWENR